MRPRLCIAIGVLAATSAACSQEQSWTGVISDDLCRSEHMWDEHDASLTPRDCTLQCVKAGRKFVLIAGRTVYPIRNQEHAGLAAGAGLEVTVTGRMEGDAVLVSRVEVPDGNDAPSRPSNPEGQRD